MPITPFQVTLWIELLAAGLGGLQGALFAAGVRARRIDVLGVIVIGLAVSLGGSLLRDIVLVVGVIGAIGGGMLRDVILSLPFSFLHVGTLYAVAAGAGTGVFILLAELGTSVPIAGGACVMVTTLLRVATDRFDWTFPEPLTPR